MADYISRDAVLELIEPDARPFLAERVRNIPSADVVDREAYNQMVDLALSQGTIVNKIKELVGARNG